VDVLLDVGLLGIGEWMPGEVTGRARGV